MASSPGQKNRAKPQSMTGFGSAQIMADGYEVRCDIRSVNGKGLDIKLRLPSGLEAYEQPVKKRVADYVSRGNVQLSLNIETASTDTGLTIDRDALIKLHAQAKAAADDLGVAPPSMDALISVRGIVTLEENAMRRGGDDPALKQALFAALDEALVQFRKSRENEGAALVAILNDHLATTDALVTQAAADKDSQPDAIKTRFHAQLAALLTDETAIDAQRVAAEVAILVTRADVREEIDRLKTHIEAGRALLADGDTIGRRLDFLIQEFNREANTLCSKSTSKGLTAIGLEMKSVIDQMREQVQNLQ